MVTLEGRAFQFYPRNIAWKRNVRSSFSVGFRNRTAELPALCAARRLFQQGQFLVQTLGSIRLAAEDLA